MIPFRQHFNNGIKDRSVPWLEMGQEWTPKGKYGWMAQLSPGALNLISIAPAAVAYDKEDEDKESKIKQSRGVVNQY